MYKPISKEQAEHYLWGEHCDGWHLAKSDALSVIRERVPPGAGEVPHRHLHAEQFFYVLEGVATMEIDDAMVEIVAHSGIHVPAGVAHRLENRGVTDLEFLVISTPPSHGDRELV